MSEAHPPDDEHTDFAASVAAIEATAAFHLYCQRLHRYVVNGERRDLVDESRHSVAVLARAERWTPSVMLKPVRRGCYLENAGPDEVGRHAEEIDRLLFAYFDEGE